MGNKEMLDTEGKKRTWDNADECAINEIV